ncbi:MAG: PIG-L family deacetylase [Candidatus Heimdallarchaeota archaeon]|nr:MAG: PIG-L family deacetylase [Candidatus Heimdallarchaeota archaeon]
MTHKKVILAIYAHPDDAEFLAGGTLAKWAEEGHQIFAICATNGNLGAKITDITPEELAKTRKVELTNAMKTLGGEKAIFLDFPDGFLRDHIDQLKERLIYWVRKLKPDRVITFDPWKKYQVHPDHIEVGRMASEAVTFSCFPMMYPEHLKEGLGPHQPEELWYMIPIEHKPNRLVDITHTMDKKMKAIFCHQSQVEMMADLFVEGADPTNLTEEQKTQLQDGAGTMLRMVSQALANLSNGDIELAEVFYAIKLGPGMFDNYQEMIQEMIGIEQDSLEIF